MVIRVTRIDEDVFSLEVEGRPEDTNLRIRGYTYLTEDLGHLLSRTGAVKAQRVGGTVKIEITEE